MIRRRLIDPARVVPSTGWSASIIRMTAAIMAFLGVLALAAGMASDRLAKAWRADLTGIATVRLNAPPDKMAERLKQVVNVLRTTPGIDEVRVLGADEQARLLAPWLGADLNLADLPAPQLIDVLLRGAGPDAAALQDRLDRTVEGAVYDDHATWRAPLTRAAQALERLAWVATLMTVLAAGAMIAIAARLTLMAHADVVKVIRLIGGEDTFIANAFVSRLSFRAWTGGLAGAILGGVAIWMLPRIEAQSAVDVSLMPGPLGWLVLLVAVPLATGLIAWATARVVVRMTLARIA